MNLENLSQKQLSEIEIQVRNLRALLSKAKLHHEPLTEALQQFETELSELRRSRFDVSYPEYHGY